MNPHEIWAELKRRRVVRVAVAYAAAVFVALQVADLTFEPLGLPEWAYRFLVVVSLVGFPVAVALAWAFDVTPEGVKKERAATTGGGRSMGRMVVGGAAVAAVLVGGWQLRGGPEPVVADAVDRDLIAVVPFRVASTDERVTLLREGIVDMLAPIFSGSPRTVDSGAMISAWRGYAGGEDRELSEGEAVELARRLGAGRVLVGSVVGTGESFVLGARLLGVPGGDAIGDASVDGSASTLRESVSLLARQILSMEAGVERGQIDYLADVPLGALEDYLVGRRAYRQSAYVDARNAFARALDADSTFALAALGAREAVQMGLDADRADLGSRANRLLARHMDRLPPRDRTYAELWLGPSGRASAVETERRLQELVSRLPDKAEAWFVYGDWLFHASFRVEQPDWLERSVEAFNRAASLDPGLEVVDQHLLFAAGVSGDTATLRTRSERFAAGGTESESAALGRAMLAYVHGDPDQVAWIDANLGRLSFPEAQYIAANSGFIYNHMPPDAVDRAFERMEVTAVAEADRRQTLEQRYAYLRSAGRSDEADAQLRLIEAAYGPRPDAWLGAALYWEGLREPAEAAAAQLAARIDGEDGPLEWTSRYEACLLELWRLREGDASQTDGVVERLRTASDDPDPAHGRNALCALTLETLAAHRRGAPEADMLLDELVRVLDAGPASVLPWASLEAAWMLEARGDMAAAARVAAYRSGSDPFAFAASTVLRESGRLAEAAGDAEKAIDQYEQFLGTRAGADERFDGEDAAIRARLEALSGGVPRR